MKRSDPQMRIRLPVDVKAWLAAEAERNFRTENAEIVVAIKARMATTGVEFGDLSPAAAATTNDQEITDDQHDR